MRTGINWTEDETILAFQLYLTTPFGKISENYPPIIELSKLLGRTPSAVALKMQNLAANDPQQISRGIKAMQHGSKIDSLLWTKYADRWDELEKKAEDCKRRQFRATQSGEAEPLFRFLRASKSGE